MHKNYVLMKSAEKRDLVVLIAVGVSSTLKICGLIIIPCINLMDQPLQSMVGIVVGSYIVIEKAYIKVVELGTAHPETNAKAILVHSLYFWQGKRLDVRIQNRQSRWVICSTVMPMCSVSIITIWVRP